MHGRDDEHLNGSEPVMRLALSIAGIGLAREDLATGRVTLDATFRALLDLPDAPQDGDDRGVMLAAIHPDDRAGVVARADAARRGEAGEPFEVRFATAAGAERLGRLHCVLQRDADGTPRALIGVLQDVTDQRRGRDAEEARRVAEQASRAKSEFLSRISHDLRTPLNAVLGFCDLLQHSDRHPLADEPAEQVAYIDRAGRHLRKLIDGLIDMARIDIGLLKIRSGRADLGEAAAASWAEAAPRAAQRHATLLPFVPIPAPVAADAARVRQIVDHLVDNAIRYNREGGRAELKLAPRNGGWELAVIDTGAGMTPAQIASAFEPFARRGDPAAARGQGLGFGLPISAHVARAMGGRLEIDSTPGVGSTFRLWLPQAEVPRTVLQVADSPLARALVRETLRARPDLVLSEAATAAQALQQMERQRPALMVLDLGLPDGSAWPLLQKAAADGAARCVALAGDEAEARRPELRAQPGVAVVVKPLRAGELLAAVDAALAAR